MASWFFFGMIVGVVLSAVLLAMIMIVMTADWRYAAIQRGFAEYDAKTGKWKWKKPRS